MKLIHSYSAIKFKLIFFIFLLGLVFTFCNSEQPIVVENICGEAPNNFIEPDIKNNPNYVFEPDSNFAMVNLLYLFIWQSIEIESSFRYIANTLHLIFIYLFIEFDSYQKNGTLSNNF